MRAAGILLLIAFLCFPGCDSGMQRGKFSDTRQYNRGLEWPTGQLSVIEGKELKADGQPAGPEKPLLYLLVMCPGVVGYCETSADIGTYRSVLSYVWHARPADVPIEVVWDRRRDIIEVHGQRFDRTGGNVFVIVRDPAGRVSSRQLESLDLESRDGEVDLQLVMQHIREQLPDDELVAAARLVEIP